MPQSERFTRFIYDRTVFHMNMNETRRQLFTHKGRQLYHIVPTHATKRAVRHGGQLGTTNLHRAVPDI
ncbi:hypothetical protein LSAT2_015791, partial [Lamellibrachia satsuma]